MIDPKVLLGDPDFVARRLRTRGVDQQVVDAAHGALVRHRHVRSQLDDLRARVNHQSKRLAELIRRGDPQVGDVRRELNDLKPQVLDLEHAERQATADATGMIAALPNIPDARVPVGRPEDDNAVLRVAGTTGPTTASATGRPHWETAAGLGLSDPERAAKLSGAGFTVLRGDGARLLRALLSFGVDLHRDRYQEIVVPHLVRQEALLGTGHLPRFSNGVYRTASDDLWAVPTAEVPLVGLHRDEIIDARDLPLCYVAQLSCFRREAGASGSETRGIQRLHEYHQVELLRVVHPDAVDDEFELILADAETALQRLDLPYRVVELCTGDLPQSASRAYRLDAYAPGIGRWLGVSTVSTFSDYQARRSRIRTRLDGRTRLVGTLNASAVAASRLWGVLLETGRQADGTVRLPAALHPYMGRELLTGP